MGKRSPGAFLRIPQDHYATPAKAVRPLVDFIGPGPVRFIEPCCAPHGGSELVRHLVVAGLTCVGEYGLPRHDARAHTYDTVGLDCFISNPPWTRPILHDLVLNLSRQRPCWLLIDSDWLFTKQSAPFLPRLRTILAIGRVRWIEGSLYDGKDNCAWCLFDEPSAGPTIFVGRLADSPAPTRSAVGRPVIQCAGLDMNG
jgi:hypothetical protein